MTRMITLSTLIKFAVFSLLAAFALSGTAAAACGGKNQDACPWYEDGPACRGDLTRYKGKCRAWGQRNEKPWPKGRPGFMCDKGLAPQSGLCKPCGAKDGQPPCQVGRIPSGCFNGLVNEGGVCRGCGGPNQKACPKLEGGYPCRGQYEPDSANVCRPCGGENQKSCRTFKEGTICKAGLGEFGGICRPCGGQGERACPWMEKGRQCAEWTTETNGTCQPCGDDKTQACKVTDKGKACKEGYKWKIGGTCELSIEEATRRAALAKFDELGESVIGPALRSAVGIQNDEAYQRSLENQDGESDPPSPDGVDPKDCENKVHQSYTVGLAGGVQLIVGAEGEVGGAFRCENRKGQSDSKWYSSGAIAFGPSVGVDAGVTYGLWTAPYNRLRGKSHGYVFDLFDLASKTPWLREALGKVKVKVKGVPVQPSFAIGFWFARTDDDLNGRNEWLGEYQGMTITVGATASEGIGAKYVASKTVQFCDYDMDCALFDWREVDDDEALKPDGLRILVHERDKEKIVVDIYRNGQLASNDRGVTFERATATDWRDYKRLNSNGDVIERICFRKNFEFLMYMDRNRNCDRGKSLKVAGELPERSGTSAVRAPRAGEVSGPDQRSPETPGTARTWVMEVGPVEISYTLDIEADVITMTPLRPGPAVRFARTEGNRFESDAGDRITLLTPEIAAWQSADRSRTYRLVRK